MAEVEIGIGKTARRAYRLARRRHRAQPRAPATPRTSTSRARSTPTASRCRCSAPPPTASRRRPPPSSSAGSGSAGVLHLEGLWTRYEDPEPVLDEIAGAARRQGHPPAAGDLRRAGQARADRRSASPRSRTPASPAPWPSAPTARSSWPTPCCGPSPTCWSSRRAIVSRRARGPHGRAAQPQGVHPPLRDARCWWAGAPRTRRRCTSCAPGRPACSSGAGTGAAGVTREVLGVGVPLATALADARAARMRHLDETGVYCHVIADGGVTPVATSPGRWPAAPTP